MEPDKGGRKQSESSVDWLLSSQQLVQSVFMMSQFRSELTPKKGSLEPLIFFYLSSSAVCMRIPYPVGVQMIHKTLTNASIDRECGEKRLIWSDLWLLTFLYPWSWGFGQVKRSWICWFLCEALRLSRGIAPDCWVFPNSSPNYFWEVK